MEEKIAKSLAKKFFAELAKQIDSNSKATENILDKHRVSWEKSGL